MYISELYRFWISAPLLDHSGTCDLLALMLMLRSFPAGVPALLQVLLTSRIRARLLSQLHVLRVFSELLLPVLNPSCFCSYRRKRFLYPSIYSTDEHCKVLADICSQYLPTGFPKFSTPIPLSPNLFLCTGKNASHSAIAQESCDSWAYDIWPPGHGSERRTRNDS